MRFLLIPLLFASSLLAQTDGTLHLFVGSPAAPANISTTLTGPSGPGTYCYTVVARYPVGNATLLNPSCVTTGPNTLTNTNFITVTWAPLQGATGYDVLRLPGQTVQSCTNCLLQSNSTSTSVADVGAALGSYTVNDVGGAQCVFYINNRDFSVPTIVEQCALPFKFGGCIIFPDLTQQCTAAGGGGTGVTNINTITPILGGPITTTGTISCPTCFDGAPVIHNVAIETINQTIIAVPPGTTGQVLTSNGPSSDPSFQPAATSGGTVTNIATTSPITGGPITTTGTIGCATCVTNVTGTSPIASTGGTTPDISCTTCYIGTPTQHDVMLMALTQTVTAVPPSTSGYVLTSNGPSSDPSFKPVSSGGLTCNKYTVTQSPFGTTWTVTGQSGQAVTSTSAQTINIVTLASKTVINALRFTINTPYAGTSMTDYVMSLGTSASGGAVNSFEPNFTVGGSANTFGSHTPFGACTAACPTYFDDGGSFSGADNGETVTATFTQTGGTNLTATTAGTLDIDLCTTVLP